MDGRVMYLQVHRRASAPPARQQGVVMVLFTFGLAVIIGFAGLALDSSNAFLNLTRLQNAVDSAALAAAAKLSATEGDVTVSHAEALRIFSATTQSPGNGEMKKSYDDGDLHLQIQFSATIIPFVTGTSPAKYVRVKATNFRLPGWFIPVLGFDNLTIGTSAVAGPSPRLNRACGISPFMVCNGTGGTNDNYFGHNPGQVYTVKTGDEWDDKEDFEVGSGNFRLIDWSDGGVVDTIRHQAAGREDECLDEDTDTMTTKTGDTDGPVVQGLNTRFGNYFGLTKDYIDDYPPDVIVQQPDPPLTFNQDTQEILFGDQVVSGKSGHAFYNHEDYVRDIANKAYDNEPVSSGAYNRRTLIVPVGQCDGPVSGKSDLELKGFLCFHLLQVPEQDTTGAYIYAQLMEGCKNKGTPSFGANGYGPYTIQLYKDTDSDSS